MGRKVGKKKSQHLRRLLNAVHASPEPSWRHLVGLSPHQWRNLNQVRKPVYIFVTGDKDFIPAESQDRRFFMPGEKPRALSQIYLNSWLFGARVR